MRSVIEKQAYPSRPHPNGTPDHPPTSPGLLEAKETLLSQIDELRRSVTSPTEVLESFSSQFVQGQLAYSGPAFVDDGSRPLT